MKKFISILISIFAATVILSSCGTSNSGIRYQDRKYGWNKHGSHHAPDIGSLGERRSCDCAAHW